MALFVGTSGWAYPEWQPEFYPAGLARAKFLGHYSQVLSACEVNATFYRLQSERTVGAWATQVPEGFQFVVKAHRRITHGRAIMADPDEAGFVDAFVASLAPLGSLLAAVLLQFPPYRRVDTDGLARLLDRLPEHIRAVCEFRHASWDAYTVDEVLASTGAGRCVADVTGGAPEALPTGRVAHVRLRSTHYDDAQRDAWLALLTREGRDRPVVAVAKHEGVPTGDPHAGVGFACWLSERASTEGPPRTTTHGLG